MLQGSLEGPQKAGHVPLNRCRSLESPKHVDYEAGFTVGQCKSTNTINVEICSEYGPVSQTAVLRHRALEILAVANPIGGKHHQWLMG